MALTDSVIIKVEDRVHVLDSNTFNYVQIAESIIAKLEKDPQFHKYLEDTFSGKALYNKLLDLLKQIEALQEASKALMQLLNNFITRQKQINNSGM